LPALAEELLVFLEEKGYQLFLATSKPTVYASEIIRHHGLSHYFNGIVGSNLNHSRLEKTEIIGHLLSIYNLRPEESLMIGDRIFDITGARENGLQTMFVTYGYGSNKERIEADADFVAESTDDINSIVNTAFKVSGSEA